MTILLDDKTLQFVTKVRKEIADDIRKNGKTAKGRAMADRVANAFNWEKVLEWKKERMNQEKAA